MTLLLEYVIELDSHTKPDDVLKDLRQGFRAFGSPDSESSSIAYSTQSAKRSALILSVSVEPDLWDMERRGYAGLVGILLGNTFRSAHIKRVTLLNARLTTAHACLPGPHWIGSQPVRDRSWALSVPVPRSLAAERWTDVCGGLVDGGVKVITDLTPSPNAVERSSRFRELVDIVNDRPPVELFFYTTGDLTYTLALVKHIQEEMQSPHVRVGIRLCPLSSGFSTFQFLRSAGIPIFAYTVSPIPQGDRGWSIGAYLSLLNLFGANLVNVGLLSQLAFDRGTIEESLSSLRQNPPAAATLGALTGSVTPRAAYEYARSLDDLIVLHTMRPLLRDFTDSKKLRRNVLALSEAVRVGARNDDPTRLFASKSAAVRNWRNYEKDYPK